MALIRLNELSVNKTKEISMLEERPLVLGGHKRSKRDIVEEDVIKIYCSYE